MRRPLATSWLVWYCFNQVCDNSLDKAGTAKVRVATLLVRPHVASSVEPLT